MGFQNPLVLEGAQAGLKWLMILKKREGYKKDIDQAGCLQDLQVL